MTVLDILLATLQGLLASTGFLLTLFIGFLVVAGLSKLRARDRNSAAARNISERLGTGARYLLPDAPRGPADQLRTPELLEQAGHNS